MKITSISSPRLFSGRHRSKEGRNGLFFLLSLTHCYGFKGNPKTRILFTMYTEGSILLSEVTNVLKTLYNSLVRGNPFNLDLFIVGET